MERFELFMFIVFYLFDTWFLLDCLLRYTDISVRNQLTARYK